LNNAEFKHFHTKYVLTELELELAESANE